MSIDLVYKEKKCLVESGKVTHNDRPKNWLEPNYQFARANTQFRSSQLNFGLFIVVCTFARENSNKIWFSARLFVPLQGYSAQF